MRDSLVASSTSTVYTAAQVGSSGGGLSVLAVSGMTAVGAAAVRSNGGQSTGTLGTTPAPVLNNTPLFSNPVISAVSNGTNGGGTTVRDGYADVAIAGYNVPATGLDLCYVEFGETSATITWGGTSATAFASVAIELAAPPPIYASIYDTTSPLPGILKRAARYRLSPPAVVTEEAAFVAAPIKVSYRQSVLVRPARTHSILRLPIPEEPPAPPVIPSDENLAPVIYGYGAM